VRVRSEGKSERKPLPKGFGALWTTVAIDLVGFGIVLPLLPRYAEDFGATPTTIGLLVASFSLAQLVLAPIMGRLSDRFGRKPVLIVSLLGTAVGSLVTGLAGSVALLFVGRIVDGASGASVSVAQAAAADLADPKDRPRLMGLLGAAFGVGFVAGPVIGGLGALVDPRLPFFLAAAIAFTNAIVAIVRLPETNPSIVAAAAGPPASVATDDAVRVAGLPSLDGPGLAEPAHLDLAEHAATSTAAGGTANGGTADGPSSSAITEIRRLIVTAFVGVVAFAGFEATFSLLLERRFGVSAAATAGVFAAVGVMLVAVQGGLVGPINARLGESRTLRSGLLLNACGLALLAADLGWAGLAAALVLLSVGQGMLTPTLSSAVSGRAAGQRGRWLGWQQSAGAGARVVGPILAGALFEHVGVGAPYVLGAVLALLAMALVPTAATPTPIPITTTTGSGADR